MRIVFHKRGLKEIRGRLLTREWEVSSLLGFVGFAILIFAIYVSVLCIYELNYCNPNKLKYTYQVIDTIEAKDSYRGYSHLHITTLKGDVYHIPDYVLKSSINDSIEIIEAAAGQFVKIQYYTPWFSSTEIRGLSIEDRVLIDVSDSCRLSRTHSLQLLFGAIVAFTCALVIILPLATGIVQIKPKSERNSI